MKSWPVRRLLLPGLLAGCCGSAALQAPAAVAPHAFGVRDLVILQRVADPQLSPDGHYLAFTVRRTDYAANRGETAIYLLDLRGRTAPQRWIAHGDSPRWAADGKSLYYLAPQQGVAQLWRQSLARTAGAPQPQQVTNTPLDVLYYKLSPDGKAAALSYAVFTDCQTLACTEQRLAQRAGDKSSGRIYRRLFVRHWDTWADGRRNQLFYARFDARGRLPAEPRWLSRGLDGDVPSKPLGEDSEFAFAPDGQSVYFDLRIAGAGEPWSTNFDIYRVPVTGAAPPSNLTAANHAWDAHPVPSPDGKTLYYLAMKQPGFEADRFAVMALKLADGRRREIDPHWDRSPASLAMAPDGRHLYVTADDEGQHPLFSIDLAGGKVRRLVGDGSVAALSSDAKHIVFVKDDLQHPADLYRIDAEGGGREQLTHFNQMQLAQVKMGKPSFFHFRGWNNQQVQGYVMKPVDYQAGKRYPVAFIIHGGPQGAMVNDWSYRWNPQTYAGQGFAVVTVNFHGSTGYGQAFTDSISGDWGGKPLEDLQRGWQAALRQFSFLDGSRACALGASYGGYMIYWIAGVWNQPWRCLIDHDGVFDTRAMYYATDELWFEEKENGGPQFEAPANYERFNPLNHVKDWRVPMLIVQGGRDYRIPETQGLSAFTALQRRGVSSELLYFPDEDHWVLKPQNSVRWHDAVNAWLKRWTQPATADGTAPKG